MNDAGRASRDRTGRPRKGRRSTAVRRTAIPRAANPATISMYRVQFDSTASGMSASSSNEQPQPLAGGGRPSKMFPGRRGQAVDEVVPVVGVQMREQELARARFRGQPGPLEPGRVAPAPLPVRVFVRSERGVTDEVGRAGRESRQLVVDLVFRMLGIRGENDAFSALVEPVGEAPLRMAEPVRGNLDAAQDEPVGRELLIGLARPRLEELDRKVLSGDEPAEVLFRLRGRGGRVDGDLDIRQEQRREEREADDVVQVEVGQEEGDPEWLPRPAPG